MTTASFQSWLMAGTMSLITLPSVSANLYWTSAPASANTGVDYYIEATGEYRNDWDDRISVDLYRGNTWVVGDMGGGWAVAGATFNDGTAQQITYKAESYDASGVYRSAQHIVNVISPNRAPDLAFDWAGDATNGGTLSGGGWAADPENGAPVNRVEVYVDGGYRGNAALGGDRPDVSNHFGRGDYRYSGFNISYGISGFSIGGHTVMVRAFDQQGAYSEQSRTFSVNNTAPLATIWADAALLYTGQSTGIHVRAQDVDNNATWLNLDVTSPVNGYYGNSGNNVNARSPDNNGLFGIGTTGDYTRHLTVYFPQPGTYVFRAAAGDPYATSYSGNVTVTVPNRDPSVSIQILDSSKNVIPLNNNGRAPIGKNSEFYIRVNGSDPDGRLARLYSRVNNASGAQLAYEHRDVTGGGASWDFGPYNTGVSFGVWDVWGHAEDLDQSGYQWNGGGWAGSHAPDILVYSPPQGLTLTGVPGAAINLGQSIDLLSDAFDESGNMTIHSFWRRGPRTSNSFSDWNDWVRDYDNRASWSNQPNPGQPSGGGNSRITATFTPNEPGWWQFHANAVDGDGYWGPGTTSTGLEVKNVYPTNELAVSSQVNVGDKFTLTHTAGNPTSLSHYEVGFRIEERREDALGAVIPGYDWTEINDEEKSVGNKSFTQERPAPTKPGKIIYHIYSWNQWMTNSDNLRTVTVIIPNRPPENLSMTTLPTGSGYGQSVTVTARAKDLDGDLKTLHMLISGPGAAKNGTWAGDNPSGEPWNHFVSVAATDGGDSTVSSAVVNKNGGVTLPLPVGTYRFTLNSQDGKPNYTYSKATVMATLVVAKATPTIAYADKVIVEGTALTATHLGATSKNPNNSSLTVPGTIAYTITAGGVAPYPNGTLLQIGQVLPASTYTISASIAESANYNAATKSVTFTVSSNPNADNDGDGVSNGTELELGTDPNAASESDPAPLNVQIHTPPSS